MENRLHVVVLIKNSYSPSQHYDRRKPSRHDMESKFPCCGTSKSIVFWVWLNRSRFSCFQLRILLPFAPDHIFAATKHILNIVTSVSKYFYFRLKNTFFLQNWSLHWAYLRRMLGVSTLNDRGSFIQYAWNTMFDPKILILRVWTLFKGP